MTVTITGLEAVKAAPTGASVECPQCRELFTKASYQQSFCSYKGAGNCKDAYWNAQGPRVRTAKAKPSPAEDATDAARAHLATLFGREYQRYIQTDLAGDFACALVKLLSTQSQEMPA